MNRTARAYANLTMMLIFFASAAESQKPNPGAAENAKILAYIDGSWNTLSRSMTSCKSLIDPKVTTPPILYLPSGMPIPSTVASAQQQCKIEVRNLPRKISHMGEVRVAEIPDQGLLYLPNPYVVPGGRFNEMYGWESYFIVLGLVEDKRTDLAREMVENFFFEIENYGAILNANRTYYLTRSQPPFLTSMIREVYEHQTGKPLSKAWLAKAYSYAQRDYALWSAPPHLAGDAGLARYADI